MKIPKKHDGGVLEVHSFKVGEKKFGKCMICGKSTLGASNALCSRDGGPSVADCLGMEQVRYDFLMSPRWMSGP